MATDPLHHYSNRAFIGISAGKENTARSGLSAIAMARQAALLLLTALPGFLLPQAA